MDRRHVRPALLTGIAMGDEAESGSLLKLHIGSVVLIGVGIVLALVFGDTLAVLRSAKELFVFDRTDISFVVNTVRHPGRARHVRWGKVQHRPEGSGLVVGRFAGCHHRDRDQLVVCG